MKLGLMVGAVLGVAAIGGLIAAVAAQDGTGAAAPKAPAAKTPLVMAFQKQKDAAQVREASAEAAAFLSQRLGRPVEAFVPIEYGASVQALVSQKADVAYVSAIPFLLAQRDGGATLLLAEQRADTTGAMRTTYDSVLVARQESTLSSLADVVSRASELSVCFTSTTSASGYVMPYSALIDAGLLQPRQDVRTAFARATFGGSYTAALTEVLEGRADLAAVSAYTVEGATADTYLPAGERAKLKVIARFPNVPTHLICVRGGLDESTRAQLREALLAMAKERPDLIRSVYGAEGFVEVDAQAHIKPMREALQRLGVNVEQLVR